MKHFTLNIRGRLVEFNRPAVMGIVNATPDSFFAGSRVDASTAVRRACDMLAQGADILDIGACSTRPGAEPVSQAEELERLGAVLPAVRSAVGPDAIISVDTFRAEVARRCVREWGADIINDISCGTLDAAMFATVAELRVPYVLMHMRGTPADMALHANYTDVAAEVIAELSGPLAQLEALGVDDVIVDPGFGFAKTLEQNYELMRALPVFEILGRPLLVGISRKSMITRLLGIAADDALPATCALNALALERGAAILRVHDVAQARQTVEIYTKLCC